MQPHARHVACQLFIAGDESRAAERTPIHGERGLTASAPPIGEGIEEGVGGGIVGLTA